MKSCNKTTFLAGRRSSGFSKKLLLAGVAALMAVGAQAQVTFTPVFTNVWTIPAGTYSDLPADANNTVRGIAISPVTTNVLFASRTASNHVATLAFAGGSYLASLPAVAGIGTLALEGVRVADDGAVYASNLSGAPASTFRIFRWPSELDVVDAPTTVFDTAAAPPSFQWRIGDYMDARGGGINTELVFVGNGSAANITTNFVIFRPTDATCLTFTNFTITIPGGVNNLCGAGVAFEGTNNAIWIRQASSQNTRRVAYNPTNLTATVTRTNTVDQSACQGLKYLSYSGVEMLATVQGNSAVNAVQIARVFQIPAALTGPFTSVLSSNIPVVTGSQNGNTLGNVDAKQGFLVFGAPGHGLSFFQLGFVTNSPPSVTITGSGSTFVAGYGIGLTNAAAAAGSKPLSYQWYFSSATATNPIVGATTNVMTVANLQTTNAGGYFVIVTNLYGKATSSVASVTVLPNGSSLMATQLWKLTPGSVGFLAGAGDTERGLAYDPVNQRVVVISRAPTNGVHLVDAATGVDQGEMNIDPLLAITPPGIFPMNMCGVADDGAVYVANLITSGNSDSFAIYRWDGATNTATMGQAYAGNPLSGAGALGRIGDTLAVRGAGTNTQILCSFRNGTNVAIFTTADGVNFDFNLIAITNLAASIGASDPFTGASPLGLGVAWGAGDTFWAKASSYNLRHLSFDLAAGTGAVLGSYGVPATEAPLGVDIANGYAALIGYGKNASGFRRN